MLELKVYDGDDEVVLQFEHSLLSLSKWESKNKIPFLSKGVKPADEMIEYFQDMLLTQIDSTIVYRLSPEQLEDLANYVNDTLTASTVPEPPKGKSQPEVVTSELIYYWMTALKINWSAETWHLSRLMTLVQITNFKSQPEKPINKTEAIKNWHEINERNKKILGTEG